MRRMASILALGLLLGGVIPLLGLTAAVAHVCTNPVEVAVGKTFSVNIGVAAEDKAITRVEMTVPDGFDLQDSFGFLGWTGERNGDVVAFTGGEIPPYQCGFFALKGSAPKKGDYVVEIIAVAGDGARRVYANRNPYSAFPAMNIYAGMPIPPASEFAGGADDGGDGVPWKVVAGALGAGVLAVGIAWRVRNRSD